MKSINQSLANKLAIGIKTDMELSKKIKAATKTEFLSKVKLILNNLFGVYKYFAIATKKEKMEIEKAIIYLNNIIDNINIESEKQLDLIEENIYKFNDLEICKTNNISCKIVPQTVNLLNSTTFFNPSAVAIQINSLNSKLIEHQLDASKTIIDNINDSAMTGNFKHTLSTELNELLNDAITDGKKIEQEMSSFEMGQKDSLIAKYLEAFTTDVLRTDYKRKSFIEKFEPQTPDESASQYEDEFDKDFVKELIHGSTEEYKQNKQLIRFKTEHSQKATTGIVGAVISAIYTKLFKHPSNAKIIHDELAISDILLGDITNKYTILLSINIPYDNEEDQIKIATVSIPFSFKIDTNGKLSSQKFWDPSITVSKSDLSQEDKIKLFSGYDEIKNQVNMMQEKFNASNQPAKIK